MTQAKFFRKDNMTFRATIDGHANCDVNGSDPVCAACSILVNTLANYLSDLHDAGYTHKGYYIEGDGAAYFQAVADQASFEAIQVAFAFTQKGFEILAHAYPDHVKIIPSP